MQPLTLELLGPPRLLSPQGESLLAARIPLALLAYLSLEDRAFARDHLAVLFWPGMDRNRQLHNLRQTILRIRNGSPADLIEGNGSLSVGAGALRTDAALFMEHIGAGRISEGIALWRGPFLEGFRRPESWELEDWVDRRRSMLEETFATAVTEEGRRLLKEGSPEEALSLLNSPRRLLPYREELGGLEVMALAAAGRVAEGEGLLKTLELDGGSELSEEVAEALVSAPSPPEPTPPPHRSRIRRALTWLIPAAAVALVSLGLLRRHPAGAAAMLAEAQAGHALLVSADWATDGAFPQLFRMGFDGTNKHRLSEGKLREAIWVQEADAVFGPMPDAEGVSRLFRLTANPENPIAEWDAVPVESARQLRNPRLYRANSKVGAGGVLVFSAEDEGGNRDIYGLETVSGELRRLTRDPGIDEWPSVQAGGDRVLFTSFRSGGGDIYSVGLDGTGLIRLTDDPLQDSGVWVRGDSALFVRGRGVEVEDGNMELVLLELATGTEHQLTNNAWNDFEPMWSPDGRFICWQSERLGHYESDIMVMDLRAGRSWNATEAPGRESDCSWAPEGNGLLYLRWGEDQASDVYLQDPHGGDPVNLSRYPGREAVLDFLPMGDGVG